MIKRRNNAPQSEADFIEGSLAHQNTNISELVNDNLDPKAPRKFKSHTLQLNEFEYNLIVELAEQYGQTHSGIIRFALKQLANNTK